MIYYIDGYNLIFSLIESKESMEAIRKKTIRFLQKKFEQLNLQGIVVFDGSHRRGEESGLSYSSPLTIAYTPKGQSADEYIVEQIASSAHPKSAIVITNDKGLVRHVCDLGAKTQENKAFIQAMIGRSKKRGKKKKEPVDTKQNIDRLLKIFEERLKKGDSEDFEI